MKKVRIVITVLAAAGLIASTVSAPAITSVSGNFKGGSPVVVNGSGFGSRTILPLKTWDNFESGTCDNLSAGTVVSTGQRTGSKFCGRLPQGGYKKGSSTTYKEFYVSAWYFQPSDFVFTSSTEQIKIFRISGRNDGTYYPNTYFAIRNAPYNSLMVVTERGKITPGGSKYISGGADNIVRGKWNRLEWYYKLSSASTKTDGESAVWINAKQKWWGKEVMSSNGDYPNTYGHSISMPNTCRVSKSNWVPFYDDIYLDHGLARVELGNSPLFGMCTHREVQPYTAWADGSISITFNQGTFQTGDKCYLFVVDGNGTATVGEEVVIGGSGSQTRIKTWATRWTSGRLDQWTAGCFDVLGRQMIGRKASMVKTVIVRNVAGKVVRQIR